MAVSQEKRALKEAESAEPQAQPLAAAKSKKLIRLGILAGIVLLVAGGGVLAWKLLLHGPAGAEEQAADEEKKAATAPQTLGVSLEPFVVNLSDAEGVRYLKIKLDLEVLGVTEVQVKQHLPRIRDSLIILLSSKRYDEIGSIEGKLRLREEISQRLDQILGQGNLKQVFFTDFVVQ